MRQQHDCLALYYGASTPCNECLAVLLLLLPSMIICRTICQNEFETMPYFTRVIKMDWVGVEPTTSAMPATFYLRAAMESEIHTVQISSGSKRIINILFYY
jgi:hypothetical protein